MQTTLITAFLGGILSILSPCILPLLPAYFGYIAGTETNERTGSSAKTKQNKTQKKTSRYIIHAILFAFGFSLIFIIFGASLGSAGRFLLTNKRIIEIIGGILIIMFSIQISGLLTPLKKDLHLNLSKKWNEKLSDFKYLKSFITGAIFAFGWSPCYGPILGSILTLSIVETSFTQGMILFGVYSLGLTISLILVALLASRASRIGKRTKKFAKILQIIFALILLYLGLTMLTGGLTFLANTINSLYIKYGINLF